MNSNEIFVSLDIGTSSVKVIIGEKVNDSLNIIGVGNVKSAGLKKGAIVDIEETVHSIKKAVEQAERMIGMEIRQVIVGVTGNHVLLQPCHGVVAVSGEDKVITREDIYRVEDAAKVISIPPEREIIDVVPKQYIVDGQDEITDPINMMGVRLEMEGSIITGYKTILHNLLRCVERANLEVLDITLQPLAAGVFSLSEDEKNLGTALIDLGGGTTTIAVFEEGSLTSTSVIPLGGEHITKDLSIVLRTSTENAEKIKLKYGHAFYEDAAEDEVFSVPVIGSDQHQQFNQLELSEIIEARLEEIFEMVLNELKRLGVRDLPGGFVLTGGVSNMEGVLELAQAVFQTRVRRAVPDYIGVREPQYTTGVGLIKYASKNSKYEDYGTESVSIPHPTEQKEKRQTKPQPKQKQAKQPEEKMTTKVKKFLGYFFE
ncbi:cell division protein FtsA [Neobacillus notoginsengisoli]|uniref:Cell division protein FtsA n=1 Tax=Neobacillus notoginsengisoli TaxID=1578198 RepID=A0A417YQV6_9BACI|nr:cell division protein FtsA [Neobacillus notoginsengisoli]RHW36492.1 cell division protein FtsA [Neobacillus notoginsengisoli]